MNNPMNIQFMPEINYIYYSGGGVPSEGLLLFVDPSEVDSISLSVADYANVGSDLQSAMYTDSTHPIVFANFTALWDVLSILGNFNLLNYMGTELKGLAIYEDDTSRTVLNRALRWFGLDEVEPTITDKYLNTDHYFNVGNYA
jgi:hypothetical protein